MPRRPSVRALAGVDGSLAWATNQCFYATVRLRLRIHGASDARTDLSGEHGEGLRR